MSTGSADIAPFEVAFDPAAIDDLRRRLQHTRWPEHETVDDWSQGARLAWVQDLAEYWRDEYDFEWHTQWGTGYQRQQSTRPQTLGYGLVDSPVGQLAWVVEKFWAWTDCDGDPSTIFTKDQLLDNVTVFWFTGTGASSARLYWESAGPAVVTGPPATTSPTAMAAMAGPVTVPTGCSVFPREIRRPSRRQAEQRYLNIHWWGEPAKGGQLRRVRTARHLRRRGPVVLPAAPIHSVSAHHAFLATGDLDTLRTWNGSGQP